MQNDTVEHLRARHAHGRVEAVFNGLTCQDGGSAASKYLTVAQSAPAHVRQCGLLQWAAFCRSKNEGAPWMVPNDVLLWLKESPVTSMFCVGGNGRRSLQAGDGLPDPMFALLERSSFEIAIMEKEALAYLGWLKRLADGRWNALPKAKPAEQGKDAQEPVKAATE